MVLDSRKKLIVVDCLEKHNLEEININNPEIKRIYINIYMHFILYNILQNEVNIIIVSTYIKV